MKCVAIGGEPATGKTTLMQIIYSKLTWVDFKMGLLRGHYNKEKNLALLGIYNIEGTFVGTDKLSMAVNNHFILFAKEQTKNILFEGDRLFTLNNINYLKDKYETDVYILQQSKEILHQRHLNRNDNQSEQFLKGRKTKINNIMNNVADIKFAQLFNINDSEKLANHILNSF